MENKFDLILILIADHIGDMYNSISSKKVDLVSSQNENPRQFQLALHVTRLRRAFRSEKKNFSHLKMKTFDEEQKGNLDRKRERERNGERKRKIKREIKKRWKKGTKKREDSRGREFWRNERKRGEKKKKEKRTLRGGRGGERADKKKRSSKLTAASGRPGATGSPFRPKTLFPSSSVSQPPLVPSLSLGSLSFFLQPFASLRATVPPCMISLAPLEARQMSGIRLRHLSVSPSVTFDSRQIERRARQQRRGGGEGERR